jgi:hypothetical protein
MSRPVQLIIGLLIIGLTVSISAKWAAQQGWVKLPTWAQTLATTPWPKLSADSNLFKNSPDQLKILGQRSATVANETGQVLGSYVQVKEKPSTKPLHQKTWDHARYLYCQEVVKQYDAEQAPANPSPTP